MLSCQCFPLPQDGHRRLFLRPNDAEVATIERNDPAAAAAARQALAARQAQGRSGGQLPVPLRVHPQPGSPPPLLQQQPPRQPGRLARLAPVSVRGAWQLVSTEVLVAHVPPGPEARQLGELERRCESMGCAGELVAGACCCLLGWLGPLLLAPEWSFSGTLVLLLLQW